MSEELTMPRLSDTMEEGTIGRWLKHEGESFHQGDVIAEIETDKATMDFQAYDDGTLLKILVADGESAPLGAPIAIVGAEGEAVPAAEARRRRPSRRATATAPRRLRPPGARACRTRRRPAAPTEGRGLRPAGEPDRPPDGRCRRPRPAHAGGHGHRPRRPHRQGRRRARAAVRHARSGTRRSRAGARRPPAIAAEDEVRELTPMLKAVAKRMGESKATVPHFYVTSEIDMTRAFELRAELNAALADSGEKVSVNDLIVRACAQSLMQHPQAHRSYVDGRHVYHAHVHTGIAVALDDGLIVPVLRDADTKGVRQIAAETRDLVGRARDGKLRQTEIEGGTFTVSNMGMFDVAAFSAIINPPESTILAVSSTVERAVFRDGGFVPRKIMSVTLSCDHRACSGADGARLLQTIKRHLEAPTLLLA